MRALQAQHRSAGPSIGVSPQDQLRLAIEQAQQRQALAYQWAQTGQDLHQRQQREQQALREELTLERVWQK